VRETPPLSNKRPEDTGVQFVGWRAADKMFRSREILLQRIQNKGEQELLGNCSTSQNKRAPLEAGRGEKVKPLKKRFVIPPNNGIKQSSDMDMAGKNAVDHWFRHTNRAVQSQLQQSKEEDFQSFLKKRQLEVKQEWRKKIKEQKAKGKKIKEQKAKGKLEEPSSASINQTPNASPLPPSPTLRKHKKRIPKRNQQNPNSVILGEDPELDEMIEDIVEEFTHEFSKEQDKNTHTKGNAGASRVEFDDSAVSALREAARETLNMMVTQGTAKNPRTSNAASGVAESAKIGAVSNTSDASIKSAGVIASANSTQHCENDEDVNDKRITDMIEQLIGEVAQDSGCQFDGRAVEALREAAKEIVEDESKDSTNVAGGSEVTI